MLKAADGGTWRRTTTRSESRNADRFVARRGGVAQVYVIASADGGVAIDVPPTASTCGLRLRYSRASSYSVLMSDERSACRLDFAVTGQSYRVHDAGQVIDVHGTEADLDAFVAGGERLRAAIESDLAELRAEVARGIEEGRLRHLKGYDGCVPVYEPFDAAARRTQLAKLDQEIARRRAAMDALLRVRDRVAAEVPCLVELVEPAPVTTVAAAAGGSAIAPPHALTLTRARSRPRSGPTAR